MAAGLPIVAFDVSGVNELVENELNGILVEKNNVNQFANAIIAISNENEINRFSRNSINLSRKYDWANIAKQYLELYLKIIREK